MELPKDKGQLFLMILVGLFLRTWLVYVSFNFMGPKLAKMHGQPADRFQINFVESMALVILFQNLIAC